jgi:NitT/TauT family transport system permease protein
VGDGATHPTRVDDAVTTSTTDVAAPPVADEDPAAGGWRRVLRNPWVLRAAGLVVLLGLWEYFLGPGRVEPILAAPPSKVVTAVPDVVRDPLFLPAIADTLMLFALGVAISLTVGVFVGYLLARVRFLDTALSPYVNALYASPLPALVPIITAVFGYLLEAKLLIVVLLGVFPILINANQGAKDADPTLIEVAHSFGASERRVWLDVIFPFSVPYLLVGARLSAARALIGTVVAEIYASPSGLGYLIITYGSRFNMDSMLVVVLTFTLMGLLLSVGIGFIGRTLVHWRVSTQ